MSCAMAEGVNDANDTQAAFLLLNTSCAIS
jgi:hypothetical protein